MLNNKGQTLIIFIICIPLLLLVAAIFIDNSLMSREKNKLDNQIKVVIQDAFDNNLNESEIEEELKKNDVDLTNLKIFINENTINITNEYEIDSIFGKIIGFNSYEIKTDITGIKEDNKINFIKE